MVELLVVIAIIALLIAMLIPAMSRAKIVAGQVKCLSGARQVAVATTVYNTDWKQYFPANLGNPSNPTDWADGPNPEKYEGFQEVLCDNRYAGQPLFTRAGCPFGPAVYSKGIGDEVRVGVLGYPPVTSYGLNGTLQGGFGKPGYGLSTPSGASWAYYGQQRTSLKRIERFPARVVVVTCHGAASSRSSRIEGYSRGLLHLIGEVLDPTSAWERIDGNYVRHGAQGLPMVTADGHGQVVSRREIWENRDPLDTIRPYRDSSSVMFYSFTALYDAPTYTYDQ